MLRRHVIIFREFIVLVQPSGSSCDSSTARMMPASAYNLITLGVYKQGVANTEPDWGIIIGQWHESQSRVLYFFFNLLIHVHVHMSHQNRWGESKMLLDISKCWSFYVWSEKRIRCKCKLVSLNRTGRIAILLRVRFYSPTQLCLRQ